MFVNEKSYNIFVQGSLTWQTVNINVLWTQLEGDSLNVTKEERSNFLDHFVCLNIICMQIFPMKVGIIKYAPVTYICRLSQNFPGIKRYLISIITHIALMDYISSEGTRRLNCVKNIDVDKFAFNTLQLATFPRSTARLA